MHKTTFKPHIILIVLLAGLLCFWSAQAMAQTPEEPTPAEPTATDQPAFVTELVESTELTQEKVDQMRIDGLGWGEIVIATRLAERIAADNGLTFDTVLTSVLEAYAGGKEFGEIALEYDLKLGRVVGKGGTSDAGNQPPFIAELIESTELTQEQLDQMRSDGLGWGNIMIATRLAERIAADSGLAFADALTGVLSARAEGKGFGQIANENDLKLGRLVGKDNKGAAGASDGSGEPGAGAGASIQGAPGQAKKQSIFSRLLGLLGFDRKERPEKPSKSEKLERSGRPEKPQNLEKLERPARLERPEHPGRPEKPEKPERPEKGPGR
jgi:hypothetical protein